MEKRFYPSGSGGSKVEAVRKGVPAFVLKFNHFLPTKLGNLNKPDG